MGKKDTRSLTCAHCLAPLEFDASDEIVQCSFCGSTYSVADLLNESDRVRIEKIKNKTRRESVKKNNKKRSANTFRKSKLSKVLIVFFIIGILLCSVSFEDGSILSGLIAVIMTALFLVSWMMGMNIIKEPKAGVRTLLTVAAFVLFLPYFGTYDHSPYKSEKLVWSELEMADIIPQPVSDMGSVLFNDHDYLVVYVDDTSEENYKSYVKSCEDAGFTIDKSKSSSSFLAYNEDGYKLNMWYNESDDQIDITLDAPMVMTEFQWPVNKFAEMLPPPKSNTGLVEWENTDGFTMYIGGTSKTDFNEYANLCVENGFNIDYSKSDEYFYGSNSDGYRLSVSYEGFDIIRINMYSEN